MNPKNISVEGLVASERFQDYCRNGAETDYWKGWIQEHPEHKHTVIAAKKIILALSMEISDAEIAEEFTQLKAEIDKSKKVESTKIYAISKKPIKNPSRRKWIGIVAAITAIATISTWQFFSFKPAKSVLLSTEYGQIETHILPDGSKVILNANSILSYTEWEEQETREVTLEGEGFFEIKKKSVNEQFIVHTKKGDIQVLGTSFNVLQRAAGLEVALLEGVVELVIPKYPTIKMDPGEIVQIEGADYFDRRSADVDAFSAWRFQRIVFKEATIEKVIQRLQNEFDWTVRVTNQDLLKRKITATIPKNDPELLLQALSEIYNLKIEKVDTKTYVIVFE